MRRMPFQRPAEYYDPQITSIDEQICALIKLRQDTSGHNPGFPPLELISGWADEFGLYEDLLKAVFANLLSEDAFRPVIEPEGFRRH